MFFHRLMVVWPAAFLVLGLALPCWALSVDQVLKLRKAGVGDATIRKMIENEIAAANSGTTGRYVVKSGNGREVIVYSAKSAKGGAQDYEVDVVEEGANPDRISVILDQPRRANIGAVGVALQLGSFRTAAEARALASKLADNNVDAKTMRVDLGEKGTWHRVLIDGFANKGQAEAKGEALQQAGLIDDFWVSK